MRTLKKTLCLVLCLAMMVGLVAISASAEFTDADEIENKEEVDLLVGLGIIEGYTDGSFNPTKVLTRAEGCKIIAYLLLGKEAADALEKKDTIFTDVTAAHWASGYIGYCAKMGVVEGIGNDKFDPSGTLTAAAWGKMLLCALGYDQDIEGMTADSWDFNVTRLVTKTKLATGYAFSADTPMTRDSACLLAYNALTVPTVEYVGNVTVTTGDGTTVDVNAQKQYGPTLAEENFNMFVGNANGEGQYKGFERFGENGNVIRTAYETGIVVANAATNLGDDTAVTTIATGFNNNRFVTDDFEIETGEDLYGAFVKVYVDLDGEAISVTEIGSKVAVAAPLKTASAFKKAFGKAADKIEADDHLATLNIKDPFDKEAFAAGANYFLTEGEYDPAKVTIGATYVFDDEGTMVAVVAFPMNVTLTYVTAVNTKAGKESVSVGYMVEDPDYNPDDPDHDEELIYGTLTLQDNEEKDEVEAYEGIAKYDVVLVTKVGDQYAIAKAESISGTISKTTKTATGAYDITIEGADYSKSIYFPAGDLYGDTAPEDLTATAMKTGTYTVYLDGDGKYIGITNDTDTTPDIYYWYENVTKTTLVNDALVYNRYAVVIDADGAKSEVLIRSSNVDKDTAEAVTNATPEYVGSLVTFAYQSATKLYKAEQKAVWYDATNRIGTGTLNAADMDGIANNYAGVFTNADDNATGYLKASTKFVFINGTTADATLVATVKEGLIVLDNDAAAAAKAIFTVDTDRNAIVKTVFLAGVALPDSINPSDILYLTGAKYDKAENGVGFTYTAYSAATGEKVEITTKNNFNDAPGFYTNQGEKDGITTIAYKIDDDADNQWMYGVTFTSKIDNSIRVNGEFARGGDLDASAAKIVDTRRLDDPDDAITDLAGIKTNKNNIVLDIFIGVDGKITTIFIKAKPAQA